MAGYTVDALSPGASYWCPWKGPDTLCIVPSLAAFSPLVRFVRTELRFRASHSHPGPVRLTYAQCDLFSIRSNTLQDYHPLVYPP